MQFYNEKIPQSESAVLLRNFRSLLYHLFFAVALLQFPNGMERIVLLLKLQLLPFLFFSAFIEVWLTKRKVPGHYKFYSALTSCLVLAVTVLLFHLFVSGRGWHSSYTALTWGVQREPGMWPLNRSKVFCTFSLWIFLFVGLSAASNIERRGAAFLSISGGPLRKMRNLLHPWKSSTKLPCVVLHLIFGVTDDKNGEPPEPTRFSCTIM